MRSIAFKGHTIYMVSGSRPLPEEKKDSDLICHTRIKLGILNPDGTRMVEADSSGYYTFKDEECQFMYARQASPLTNLQCYLESKNGLKKCG